jgi:hypothetical protein
VQLKRQQLVPDIDGPGGYVTLYGKHGGRTIRGAGGPGTRCSSSPTARGPTSGSSRSPMSASGRSSPPQPRQRD